MSKLEPLFSRLCLSIVAAVLFLQGSYAVAEYEVIDVQNDEIDVTLFRGAANNSYFPVYFKAQPVPGAGNVEMEAYAVDLRPERAVTLHVEIYNPNGTIPLIVTPGGNGDTNGFGGFARNVAAASPELKVIIYDRRNLGMSEVNFGREPQMIEEGEDLHILIDRLQVAPSALYGMSSGARSNLILASRYLRTLLRSSSPLLPVGLTQQLDYLRLFFKYLANKKLTTRKHVNEVPIRSMEDLAH